MGNPMRRIAEYMEVSALTAPKAKGEDYLETKILVEDELDNLADEMIDYGNTSGKRNFERDASNVRKSDAVLLISLNEPEICLLDCGACGYLKCKDFEIRASKGTVDFDPEAEETKPEFEGPICSWRLLDLGIALGSAAKTASLFNADSRIMYRVGVVAKKMNLIEGEIVVGIPISATGKSIYFDRGESTTST